jgi:hypothetical protein
MLEHQRQRHGPQIIKKKDQMSEMIIPSTPFLGLRERLDEQSQPKKQKKEDKGEKGDRTETVSVVPSTPEKLDNQSLDESFSMMPSPVSILLGFDDHIEVSPIKGRLQSLFEPPARAVSPLPLTPEKSQVSNNKETFIVMKDPALNDLPLLALTPEESQVSDNKETFIVIEDPTLNDLDLNIISSDEAISTKRDSSHLELPTVAVEESNRSRFQAPPSAFIHSTKANSVRMIRNRAMDNQTYSSSVIPFGYVGVKKEEKVVFPDGTVYFLSAFWMADPQLSTNITMETQTPLMMLPSRMVTLSTNTDPPNVRDTHTTGSTTRTVETQTEEQEEIHSFIEEDFSFYS